jgi:hypothetical protein
VTSTSRSWLTIGPFTNVFVNVASCLDDGLGISSNIGKELGLKKEKGVRQGCTIYKILSPFEYILCCMMGLSVYGFFKV